MASPDCRLGTHRRVHAKPTGVVRAYEAAREVGLKLVYGTELILDDGLKLVLLAPGHDAYSEICALISRGRKASTRGTYKLGRADLEGLHASLCLWVPWPAAPEAAAWARDTLPNRAWMLYERFPAPDDAARL